MVKLRKSKGIVGSQGEDMPGSGVAGSSQWRKKHPYFHTLSRGLALLYWAK
jgi:hypothetical protein